MENEEIALSIRQPWAWLIVNGYKKIENRSWVTKVRGRVLVHAGLTFDRIGYDWVKKTFPQIPMPLPSAFEYGGIVGQVSIVGCATPLDSLGADHLPWYTGQFGFLLEDAKPLPFRCEKGRLGFFKLQVRKSGVIPASMGAGKQIHNRHFLP